jgi:glycosyltransferase involved in cell wall biosynthesis
VTGCLRAARFTGGILPKVSVCIPSYNLAHLIGRTIDSVLDQTFTDWELLIEDDGSTDGSVNIIISKMNGDPRIRLFRKTKNEGQNKTANNLVNQAKGKYIALLCADDFWYPDKLAKQVEWMEANPETGIVFAYPEFITERDEPYVTDGSLAQLKNLPKENWQNRFLIGNCLFVSTSMYRRALHVELGPFDESLHLLSDLEWYLRIVQQNELHIIQEVLAKITMRDNMANLSAPTMATQEKHADEIKLIRQKYRPVNRKKQKFMIATPFYEVKGYSPYIKSLVETLCGLSKHTDIEFEFIELSGDSYVWRARNRIADLFMKSDSTHLVFLDSDESWEPEGFYRLLKADADVVGAAYPVKNNWINYGVVIDTKEDLTPDVNPAGLIRASMVPTGFMKISRRVFERLAEVEPDNWYWENDEYGTLGKTNNYFGHIMENHIVYGEDISFCKRWTRIGGELFVEPRVTISHWGSQCWKGNYHEYLMQQPGGSQDPAKIKEMEEVMA